MAEGEGARGRGAVALAAGYFTYFAAVGVVQPYWPAHLAALGFAAPAIGVLMATFGGARVLGPIVAAWLADRRAERRGLLRTTACLATLCALLLLRADGWWTVLPAIAAFSLFFNGIMPVYDAHVLDRLGDARHRYGWLRLWGSVGFVASSYAVGLLVARAGAGAIPWALLAACAATAASLFLLPPAPRRAPSPHAAVPFARALLAPGVPAYLSICFLQLASFGGYYSFYTLYLQHHGYRPATIGLYWAWGVIAEIGLFLVGPRLLRRWPLVTLLRVALAGTALRWALVAAFPTQPLVMFAAQTLHFAGFGLFHAVNVLLAPRLLPPGFETRAQALVSSVGWGAGGIAGSLLSGWLWAETGPRSVYVASLIIVTFALGVSAVALRDGGEVSGGTQGSPR